MGKHRVVIAREYTNEDIVAKIDELSEKIDALTAKIEVLTDMVDNIDTGSVAVGYDLDERFRNVEGYRCMR